MVIRRRIVRLRVRCNLIKTEQAYNISMKYKLPYTIKTDHPSGNLSFHDKARWDSVCEINDNNLEEVALFYTALFHRCGDKAGNLVVEKNGDEVKIKWVMNYGRLEPRKCECTLEKIEH